MDSPADLVENQTFRQRKPNASVVGTPENGSGATSVLSVKDLQTSFSVNLDDLRQEAIRNALFPGIKERGDTGQINVQRGLDRDQIQRQITRTLLSMLHVDSIEQALHTIAKVHPKKVKKRLATPELTEHIRHIEMMYQAHVLTMVCEVGYIDSAALMAATQWIVNTSVDWQQYDRTFQFLNRLMRTRTFSSIMTERKKNKVCWREMGVWRLQQQEAAGNLLNKPSERISQKGSARERP